MSNTPDNELVAGTECMDFSGKLMDAIDGASDQGQVTWLTAPETGKRIAAIVPVDQVLEIMPPREADPIIIEVSISTDSLERKKRTGNFIHISPRPEINDGFRIIIRSSGNNDFPGKVAGKDNQDRWQVYLDADESEAPAEPMRPDSFMGAPRVPGWNVDKLDIAAGLRQAVSFGYDSQTFQMAIVYALQRHARGEEDGAQRTALNEGLDLTSWYAILAAAMAGAAQRGQDLHDELTAQIMQLQESLNPDELICTNCGQPVEYDGQGWKRPDGTTCTSREGHKIPETKNEPGTPDDFQDNALHRTARLMKGIFQSALDSNGNPHFLYEANSNPERIDIWCYCRERFGQDITSAQAHIRSFLPDAPASPVLPFTYGFNTQSTGGHEVLERNPDGTLNLVTFVPSAAKARAIAMILNAPEE